MRTLTAPNVTWQPVQGASTTTVPLQPWLYPKTGFGPRTLYLYFDESGNLDFKSSGTPFFIMTCAVTTRPFNVGRLLTDLRFDLIEHGHPIEKFHACEDVGDVRSAVYDILRALPDSYRVYSACVEKSEVPEEYRTPDAIYSKVFELLVNRVSEREISDSVRNVVAITDLLPKDAKKKQVSKPLKKYMKSHFQEAGIPYILLHHMSCSDPNLQATDYFCWAAHRGLTQGKDWPMSVCAQSFCEVGRIDFATT